MLTNLEKTENYNRFIHTHPAQCFTHLNHTDRVLFEFDKTISIPAIQAYQYLCGRVNNFELHYGSLFDDIKGKTWLAYCTHKNPCVCIPVNKVYLKENGNWFVTLRQEV